MTQRRSSRSVRSISWTLLAAALVSASVAGAQGPPPDARRGRPLTQSSQADPLDVGIGYLRGQRAALGLAASDLDEVKVADRYQTKRTGTTHLYLRQQVEGIDVAGAEVSVSIDAQGRVRTVGDRLVRGVRERLTNRAPLLTPSDAVADAARHLGLGPAAAPVVRSAGRGPARNTVLSAPALSRDPIPAHLIYVPDENGALRLSWDLVIRTTDGRHWWNLRLDAETGHVLQQHDWIARETYNAYPLPLMSPDEGGRSLEVDVADAVASPFGWHDTNGAAGAEFTDTRGNNVSAQEDVDADDSGGTRPDGGAGLVFDFPIDLSMQPGNNIEASVSNLFYWNNLVHDIMYQYGFDEPAGNFQVNNYGNGGLGNDAVQADSQDGSDVDNALFGTPPDGQAPRMEMFRWLLFPTPRLVVSNPAPIAGTYFAGMALFGGGTSGLGGSLVQALDPADGAGPSTTDACSPLTNAGAVAGKIALIDRGTCFFVDKVGHAQDAGAIGAIIVNNAGDEITNMAGVDPTLTIPAIFLGQSDGATIVAQLGVGVTGTLTSPAARDSALDNGVVVHEYGHGISNRLTGGPSQANCVSLLESAGMGEGWSDWLALVLTAEPGDGAADARGIAPYLVDEGASGGIRNFPYSVDFLENPLTYDDVPSLNQPHGVGEVWASALWQMYWNLVYTHGYDPDLYTGTGGNNLALELVTDGLKLQPCNPTMVDGRDAILEADDIANAGANACDIWAAFARRGIGFSADDDGSANSLSVTEAFDVPPTCVPEPGHAAGMLSGLLLLRVLAKRRSR